MGRRLPYDRRLQERERERLREMEELNEEGQDMETIDRDRTERPKTGDNSIS